MARKKQAAEATVDSNDPNTPDMSEIAETTATESAEAPKPKKVKGERKTGQELLDYVQANQELPPEELALGAGYYTQEVDPETNEPIGEPRLQKNEFFKSMTEASSGITFAPPKRAYSSRRGRAPIATIGKIGNCVVGARHTTVAGFEPGTQVKVEAEQGKITLTPYEGDGEAAGDSGSDDLDI